MGSHNRRSCIINLKITSLSFDVTAATENHVIEKLGRISRHASNVISVAVTLSVEKVNHKAEVDIHLVGRDLYVEAVETDMYVTIDILVDKVDRVVLEHKEKSDDVCNTMKLAARQTGSKQRQQSADKPETV